MSAFFILERISSPSSILSYFHTQQQLVKLHLFQSTDSCYIRFMSFVWIGKVHSPQGVRGQIFVSIFAEEASWVEKWKKLHLSPRDHESPDQQYKILIKKPHQKQKKWGFVLTLEGVDDRNKVEKWVGFKVYIPEEFLISAEGESIFLREVMDFQVHDKIRGLVGRVVGFSGHNLQDLLVIEHPCGDRFEVPFVEPLLIKIDTPEKRIEMDIPLGLVPGEEL